MSRTIRFSICGLMLLALPAVADMMNPDLADAAVHTASGADAVVSDVDMWGVRVGEFYAPGGSCYVMPFQLPSLAAGEGFLSADLQIQLHVKSGVPFDIDLYGLDRRAAADVLASDYYHGSAADPLGMMIEDTFVTGDLEDWAYVNTTDSGDTALVDYLNAQYADGAGAGEFVFLRLSPSVDVLAGDNAWTVLTANAGGDTERPVLTFETGVIPEPATLALFSIAGLAVVVRRR